MTAELTLRQGQPVSWTLNGRLLISVHKGHQLLLTTQGSHFIAYLYPAPPAKQYFRNAEEIFKKSEISSLYCQPAKSSLNPAIGLRSLFGQLARIGARYSNIQQLFIRPLGLVNLFPTPIGMPYKRHSLFIMNPRFRCSYSILTFLNIVPALKAVH